MKSAPSNGVETINKLLQKNGSTNNFFFSPKIDTFWAVSAGQHTTLRLPKDLLSYTARTHLTVD